MSFGFLVSDGLEQLARILNSLLISFPGFAFLGLGLLLLGISLLLLRFLFLLLGLQQFERFEQFLYREILEFANFIEVGCGLLCLGRRFFGLAGLGRRGQSARRTLHMPRRLQNEFRYPDEFLGDRLGGGGVGGRFFTQEFCGIGQGLLVEGGCQFVGSRREFALMASDRSQGWPLLFLFPSRCLLGLVGHFDLLTGDVPQVFDH